MATHFINGAIVTCANIYRFQGYTFEWHNYLGPSLCRKDGELSKRQPGPKSPFWGVLARWHRSGETFENLTLTPSIDVSQSGHWHGFITNGEIK